MGLVNRMPVFTTMFFIFILFNTAVPLSLNYLGEFLSLTGVFFQSPLISFLGATGIVLSAAYSIWVYARISYGSFSKYLLNIVVVQSIKYNSITTPKGLEVAQGPAKGCGAQESTSSTPVEEVSYINDINRREFFLLLPYF